MLRSVLAVLLLTVSAAAQELPPAGGQYDTQLGGSYPVPEGTQVVSRDRMDAPSFDAYSICYVNAFQTQPQEADWWRDTHPELLLRDATGALVEDENWPGEFMLDTSTETKRLALAAVTGEWIAGCASAGYSAVEADNLDTYSRSGGLLKPDDHVAYARLLAAIAHKHHLAFAQKNAAELLPVARAVGFDFAIVESCQVYEECDAYTEVLGRYVFEIEYTDTDRSHFEAACDARGESISIVLRDRLLTTAGEDAYHYETC